MEKTQAIRVLDVLVLGPIMVWAGARRGGLPDWAKVALLVGGAATIVYNGKNFVEKQAELDALAIARSNGR